jgi:hypothetical protein
MSVYLVARCVGPTRPKQVRGSRKAVLSFIVTHWSRRRIQQPLALRAAPSDNRGMNGKRRFVWLNWVGLPFVVAA